MKSQNDDKIIGSFKHIMIYQYGQYHLHMWILNMVLKYINLLQSHQTPILVCMHVIFWGRPKTCLFPLVFIRFVRFAVWVEIWWRYACHHHIRIPHKNWSSHTTWPYTVNNNKSCTFLQYYVRCHFFFMHVTIPLTIETYQISDFRN